ncbi:hypothetical protein AVEN_181315-1 [Araneus ventricosus]|uniref:Uncharacterized protein n=1 Tax=Araneus ventricosus TaxID=182803 RepID=A0A4Y2EGG1_ARAVE|nr:hypothetical protein AVEN_181315-1 [Araneus ventricosus]
MSGSGQTWTPDLGVPFGDKFVDLLDNSKIPENAIIFSISLLGEEIYRMYLMIPCNFTTSRTRVYKRRELNGGTSSECEDGLWSFVCSVNWKAGELSAIESSVTVFTDCLCC